MVSSFFVSFSQNLKIPAHIKPTVFLKNSRYNRSYEVDSPPFWKVLCVCVCNVWQFLLEGMTKKRYPHKSYSYGGTLSFCFGEWMAWNKFDIIWSKLAFKEMWWQRNWWVTGTQYQESMTYAGLAHGWELLIYRYTSRKDTWVTNTWKDAPKNQRTYFQPLLS